MDASAMVAAGWWEGRTPPPAARALSGREERLAGALARRLDGGESSGGASVGERLAAGVLGGASRQRGRTRVELGPACLVELAPGRKTLGLVLAVEREGARYGGVAHAEFTEGFELCVPCANDVATAWQEAADAFLERIGSVEGDVVGALRFNAVELLHDLVVRLPAPVPASSLGVQLFELFCAAVSDPPLANATVEGRRVSLEIDGAPWRSGPHLTLMLTLRIDDASARAQQCYVDQLQPVRYYEPSPSAPDLSAARAQLAAWRGAISGRLKHIPAHLLEQTMPGDISLFPPPLRLAEAALLHGLPPPRPGIGELGEVAVASAARLRELPFDRLPPDEREDLVCALAVDEYRILISHAPEDADAFDAWIRLGKQGEKAAVILYANCCERGDAFSVDGDEPRYRLFTQWLLRGLPPSIRRRVSLPDARAGYSPIPLDDWLLFGDHEGPPLDHRVEEGMIRDVPYTEVLDLPDAVCADTERARQLYHQFLRQLIAPGL